jgi:DNA-binding transcriptional ArsR family regulator
MGCRGILVEGGEQRRTYQSKHLRSIDCHVMHLRAMIDHGARERRLMSCLGDPSRFQLVTLLLRGKRCVSDLAQEVGLSQSCTTRHLQALQREQVVRGERDGKRVMFHLCLDEPEVRALVAWAISERAGKSGDSPFPALRPRGGGDLHFEGPGPGAGATGPRPAAGAPGGKPARRPAWGRSTGRRPAEPTGEGAAVEDADSNPSRGQAPARQPAPQRPPRHDLEDFLL